MAVFFYDFDFKFTYSSLQSPFHSLEFPCGFLSLTNGIPPLTLGLLISTTLVMVYACLACNPLLCASDTLDEF